MLFAFDELRGTSLVAAHPRGGCDVVSHTDAELAEICLPDGAHGRDHDGINVVLKKKNGRLLFGYGAFRNYRDQASSRGAKQATLLIISRTSHLDMFRPLLVTALDACMSFCKWDELDSLQAMLRSLKRAMDTGFANLTSNTAEVCLWGRTLCIERPLSGDIGGASLRDVVSVFRERTMLLWHAVLMERRVLFCGAGMTAAGVSTLVLATPLLVGELGSLIMDSLEPYVTLAVVQRLTSKATYVAGCNNGLFLDKAMWWDVCADAFSGQVKDLTHTRVSGADMAFISRILHELGRVPRSEAWLRRQFHDYTLSFLNRVGGRTSSSGSSNTNNATATPNWGTSRGIPGDLSEVLSALTLRMRGTAAGLLRSSKFVEEFANSKLWKRYRLQQDAAWGGSAVAMAENKVPESPSAAAAGTGRPRSSGLGRKDSGVMGAGLDASFDAFEAENKVQKFDFNHDGGLKSQAPFALCFAGGKSRPPTGFLQEKIAYSPVVSGVHAHAHAVAASSKSNNKLPPPPPPRRRHGPGLESDKALLESSSNKSAAAAWVRVKLPAFEENHVNGSGGGGEGFYLWNVETGETKWPLSVEACDVGGA